MNSVTGFDKLFLITKTDYDAPEFDNGVWVRDIGTDGGYEAELMSMPNSDGGVSTSCVKHTLNLTCYDIDNYDTIRDWATAGTKIYCFALGLSSVVWLEASPITVQIKEEAEPGKLYSFTISMTAMTALTRGTVWCGRNLLSALHSSCYETDVADRWVVGGGIVYAGGSFTNSVGDTLVLEQTTLGTPASIRADLGGIEIRFPAETGDKFIMRGDVNITNEASVHSMYLRLQTYDSDRTSVAAYSETTTSTGDITLTSTPTLSASGIAFFVYQIFANSSGTGDVDIVTFDNLGLYYGTTTTEYQED